MIHFMMTAAKNRIESKVLPVLGGTLGASVVAGCDISDGGRPVPQFQGKVHFGIHGARSVPTGNVGGYYLDETTFFNVTISMKLGNSPQYKWGDINIHGAEQSLSYMVELVKASLHGYLALAADANSLMSAQFPDDQEPFIVGEPPLFIESEIPKDRMGDWWGSTLERTNPAVKVSQAVGVTQTLRFLGLHMIRRIDQLEDLLT